MNKQSHFWIEQLVKKSAGPYPSLEPTPGIDNETLFVAGDNTGIYGRGTPEAALSGIRNPEAFGFGQKDPYLVYERGVTADNPTRAKRALFFGLLGALPGHALRGGRGAAIGGSLGALGGAALPKMNETAYSGPDQDEAERIYRDILNRRRVDQ